METFIGTLRDANDRLILTIPKTIVLATGVKDKDLVRVTIEKVEGIKETEEIGVKIETGKEKKEV